jgi:hemolysin activation/secretion protein
VQNGLRNLNDVPGVTATGVLQPGAAEGDVKLNLRLEALPLITSSVYIDNYGLKSTGQSRLIGYAQLNSPADYGDQATLLAVGTSGSDYVRTGYSLPLGYDGLRLGATAARLNYHLSGNFTGFRGLANILGASLAQPVSRTASANVFGSLSYDEKHFVNDAVGDVNVSDKKSKTFTLAASGDFLDLLSSGGRNAFNVGLVSGRIDLSRNAGDLAADSAGARTQGGYTKFTWIYSRLQKLMEGSELYFGFTGQAAGKNLDSSEKISLGGASGVRAYPTGEALGDDGWIANIELRHALATDLQGSLFLDAGQIRVLHSPFDGWNAANPSRPLSYGLQGVGIGMQYTRTNSFAIRGSVAAKLGHNPGRDANGNDLDGGHGHARAWIQFILFF